MRPGEFQKCLIESHRFQIIFTHSFFYFATDSMILETKNLSRYTMRKRFPVLMVRHEHGIYLDNASTR